MIQACEIPEEWIDDIPVSAGLQILRVNDPWIDYSEEEKEDSLEFIRCYLMKELEPLLSIPHSAVSDFWLFNIEEFEQSAFNTHDFQRGRKPFDKYQYRIKKVLEQVKDLAIMHSCISTKHSRCNIRQRCRQLIENEFLNEYISRQRLADLSKDSETSAIHKRKMRQMMNLIEECARIWKEHSKPEKLEPWEGLQSLIFYIFN